MAVKAVFLDRDNTLIEDPGYLADPNAVRLLPGAELAVKSFMQAGYKVVVVTNQSGIAKGVMSEETVVSIHRSLRRFLRERHRLDVTDILYCPHAGDECACRKPKPGMLREAARRHRIDLAASWMVGDAERDIAAGRAAGCRTIFVGRDRADGGAEYRVAEMPALPALLTRLL